MAAEKRSSAKAGKPAAPARRSSKTPTRTAGKPAAARAAASKPGKKAAGSKPARGAATAAELAAARPARAAKAAPAKAAKASASSTASASAKAPAEGLGEGDRAPSFALQDQRGERLSSEELAGSPYIIYFYPKDDTPGCTTEACGFRDASAELAGTGVRVLGVSPDSVQSHQRFASKYGLSFTLLSDPEQALAKRYGVWALKKNYGREYMGIVRSTFLVDAQGVIRKAWRAVRVNGHVAAVHAAAVALS